MTYQTTPEANKIRRKYYESCGFRNVKMEWDEDKVLFKSDEGLESVAYNTMSMMKIFHNSTYEGFEFGDRKKIGRYFRMLAIVID